MKHLFFSIPLFAVLFTGQALGQAHPLCNGSRFYDSLFVASAPQTVQYGRNARYNNDSLNLSLDVYTPVGDTATLRPVVLLAHGGTFLTGDKTSSEVVPLLQAYANRGYVGVSIQYRLDNILNFLGEGNPAPIKALMRAVQDMKAAVRFLYRSVQEDGNPYGIDTNHIYIGGSSAGALTALHYAYTNSFEEFEQFPVSIDHQAVWNVAGGLDGASGNPGYSTRVAGVINLCGALGLANWVRNGDVPLMSMHGVSDEVVPYSAGIYGLGSISIPLQGSYVIDSVAQDSATWSRLFTWETGTPGDGHVNWVQGSNPALVLQQVKTFTIDNLYELVCNEPAPVSSLAEQTNSAQAALHPNPATGHCAVQLPTGAVLQHVTVNDYHGRVVQQQQHAEIHTTALAPGLYLVQATATNGQVFVVRLMVQ